LRVTFDWEYKHSKTEELNKILNLETNLYDYVAELKRTPEI
jgi:hypothetical protein